MVVWEFLLLEILYKDVDFFVIIWGVGSNSLYFFVFFICLEGFKLLMR